MLTQYNAMLRFFSLTSNIININHIIEAQLLLWKHIEGLSYVVPGKQ